MSSPQDTGASQDASFVEKTRQLNVLNAFYKALSEFLASTKHETPGYGLSSSESNSSSFSTLLGKLALTCDTRKGRDTISALVALVGDAGEPVIILTSNYRKDHEFRDIVEYLRDLLQYVKTNPEKLNDKPLHKQVLWRILDKCQNKLDGYLTKLIEILPPCLTDCEGTNHGTIKLLDELQDKAKKVKELQVSGGTREQYLRSCEILIKAIVANKQSPLEQLINRKANDEKGAASDSDSDEWLDPDNKLYVWSDLRHCIGRLLSYRQAAEVIIQAKLKWPEFFERVKIDFVESGQRSRRQLVRSTDIEEILQQVLPEADVDGLLPQKGSDSESELWKFVQKEWNKSNFRLYVHAEMQLYKYLVQHEKFRPEHFWKNDPFIATSKPPCRLCHEYFLAANHSFRVQSSHGNFYTAWRLPGLDDDKDMNEEMIDWMEDETLRLLREGNAAYRRWDSRTETDVSSSLAQRNESRATSNFSQTSGLGHVGHSRPDSRQNDISTTSNTQIGLGRQPRSEAGVRLGQGPSQNHARRLFTHTGGSFTSTLSWPMAGPREYGHKIAEVDEGEYVTDDFEGVENDVGVPFLGVPVGAGY